MPKAISACLIYTVNVHVNVLIHDIQSVCMYVITELIWSNLVFVAQSLNNSLNFNKLLIIFCSVCCKLIIILCCCFKESISSSSRSTLEADEQLATLPFLLHVATLSPNLLKGTIKELFDFCKWNLLVLCSTVFPLCC